MYFRYNGLLIILGCFESVIWIVFDQKQIIFYRQVYKFIIYCICYFKIYVYYGLVKNNLNYIELM